MRRISFNPRPREGATAVALRVLRLLGVSIHAPVKGRPDHDHGNGEFLPGFNPRPREGATGEGTARGKQVKGFNPRPREGATAGATVGRPDTGRFQSTPP